MGEESWLKQQFSNVSGHQNSLEGLWIHRVLGSKPTLWSVGLGKGLSTCICNKLTGDVDAAEVRTAPRELVICRKKLNVTPLTSGSLLRTYTTRGKQEQECRDVDSTSFLQTCHRHWGRESLSRLTSLTCSKEKEKDLKKVNNLSEVDSGARHKRNVCLWAPNDMYQNVHFLMLNDPKLDTCPSRVKWISILGCIFMQRKIIYYFFKRTTTAICYTIDESHKCWLKKLDMKEHVLLKSVYTNFKERLNKSLLEVRTVTLGNKVSGGTSGEFLEVLLIFYLLTQVGAAEYAYWRFHPFLHIYYTSKYRGVFFSFSGMFVFQWLKGRKQTLSWIYHSPCPGSWPRYPTGTDSKTVVSSAGGQRGTGSLQMLTSGQFHRCNPWNCEISWREQHIC